MTDKDRDDLARVIADAQNVPFPGPKQKRIADAVLAWMLAAGFTRPHTVTTAAELDALPVEAVIRTNDSANTVHEKWDDGADLTDHSFWMTIGSAYDTPSTEIDLPATVIFQPFTPVPEGDKQ